MVYHWAMKVIYSIFDSSVHFYSCFPLSCASKNSTVSSTCSTTWKTPLSILKVSSLPSEISLTRSSMTLKKCSLKTSLKSLHKRNNLLKTPKRLRRPKTRLVVQGSTPQEEQPSATKNKIGRPRKYRTEEERREAQRQAVRRSRQRKNEKLALLEQENQRLKEIIPSLSLLQPK